MTTISDILLREIGYVPNASGITTQYMYWKEMVSDFGPDALIYAVPFCFCISGVSYAVLKENILNREDEVTARFKELLEVEYSWGKALRPLDAFAKRHLNGGPPSPEFLGGLALTLAVSFKGKGMRYAMAHYLSPSMISKEHRVDNKKRMRHFTNTVLSWDNSYSGDFLKLLATEFAAYSSGVLEEFNSKGGGGGGGGSGSSSCTCGGSIGLATASNGKEEDGPAI